MYGIPLIMFFVIVSGWEIDKEGWTIGQNNGFLNNIMITCKME